MPDFIPVEAFLESYSPHIRETAERLRTIVKRAVPDAIERVRPHWRLIGYDIPIGRRTRYFAWIGVEPIHVHLGFQNGILMADPERRLEGARLRLKNVRYLTFASVDQVRAEVAHDFVREAIRIARLSRGERIAVSLGELEPVEAG